VEEPWALPYSRDAYVRRFASVWTEWATGAQWAYDTFSRRQSELVARLDRLSAPPEFEEERRHLVRLVAEFDRPMSDEATPFPERARQGVATLRELRLTDERLAARASTDAQRRYSAALHALVDKHLAEYATATRKAERAIDDALRSLSRMRAPSALTNQHADVIEAFHAYRTSVREFHSACQSRQPARAEAAARQWELAREQLRSAGAAVNERLEHGAREPGRSCPTEDG
jgi:hypothetical protein